MAEKGEKTKVAIEKVKPGKVWDPKPCKDVPDVAAEALEKGLGRDVEVGKAGKDGMILTATVDLDYDEKKEELSGQISVIVTDAGKSAKSNIIARGTLKKVDSGSLDKKLRKLVEAMATKAGSDCADEIAKAAKQK